MAYSPALFCEECFQSVIDCDCNLFTDQEGNVNNDEVMIIGGIAFNAAGEALSPREQEEFLGDGEPEDWEGSYWAEPKCPSSGCAGGTSVFCLECGEDPNVCFCPAPVDWYCGSCGESWEFDPSTREDDDEDEVHDTSPESLDAILEEIRNEDVLSCKCEPQVQYYCDKCGVKRKTPKDPWVSIPKKSTAPSTLGSTGSKSYGSTSKYPASKSHSGTTYGGAYYDDDYGSYGGSDWGWSKDRHYNGDGMILPKTGMKVYASSSDDTRKPGEFVPDWGLYLDSCWRPKAWRYEYLYWPDMGTPYDDNVAIEAILEAYERMLDGQTVEIGCIGGHGRTGTVLAAMAVIEGDTPEQAMNRVWTTYCKHAIESKVQEWWIKWFYGTLFNPDYVIPERPTYKSTTYTYSKKGSTTTGAVGTGGKAATSTTPKPGTACSQGDHYIYWREGNNSCPQKETSIAGDNSSTNCRWWGTDVTSFEKGQESDATKRYYDKWIADKADEAKKAESNTKMTAVGNYIVPAPKKGEAHHNPDQKGGCQCDTCRYKAWGGSVFLETREEREARIEELNDRAKGLAFGDEDKPKISNYPGNGEELWLNVMQTSGEVLTVRISEDFDPMPPPFDDGNDEVGDTYGDYVFTSTHGWVWQGLAEVPTYMRVVQDYKRKSSSVSLDHAEAMVEEEASETIADPLLDGLPPTQEKPKKRNKRNTKSKSRKNKYTNRKGANR